MFEREPGQDPGSEQANTHPHRSENSTFYRSRKTFGLVLIASLTLTACGGDDTPGSDAAASSLSKDGGSAVASACHFLGAPTFECESLFKYQRVLKQSRSYFANFSDVADGKTDLDVESVFRDGICEADQPATEGEDRFAIPIRDAEVALIAWRMLCQAEEHPVSGMRCKAVPNIVSDTGGISVSGTTPLMSGRTLSRHRFG
ncbi:hypothetical protein [Burkholderia stabilis]|uniref:hypothetical protein n=1 Tax=Burkholderia stabilis TaxID=95485 RepID=UPI0012EA80C4|nr:hypothetical protein [Burkholderia stabilis]HDR9488818.1 hypothetical protein [Burkholderia stabilis]HDR9496608.1 hypothetical protein [Burkholderia stabilis]HDR9521077.1 hypothetical protein [Burkholderia stabilis]HDR9528320.1 hypothetical protein [Burkholderia stabilis]HDR9528828.1 hypothetical protein [Burkholderia stabilis]